MKKDSEIPFKVETPPLAWAYAGALPLLVILSIAWFVLVPPLASEPSPELLRSMIVERAWSASFPESAENLRYVLALLIVPLFMAAWLQFVPKRLSPCVFRAGVLGQALLLILAAVNLAVQQAMVRNYVGKKESITLLVVLLALGGFYFLARRYWGAELIQRFRRAANAAVLPATIGFLYLACRLLTTIHTNRTFASAPEFLQWHFPFTFNEFAAVLNGRTNQVDFFPVYQILYPYLLAPIFSFVGLSITSFTVTMALLTIGAFICVKWVFDRYTGSRWGSLALFIPFIALSSFPYAIEGNQEVGPLHYVMIPLRYLGPWFILFLIGRTLSRNSGTIARILIFAVSAALVLNSMSFGIPVLVAAFAALFATSRDPKSLARHFLIGSLLSVGTYCLFTWLRSGALPDFRQDLLWLKAYGYFGYTFIAMPNLGIHWVFVMTFLSAVVLGWALRAAHPFRSAVLIYSGIFGAGAFMYWVGRSHNSVLISVFCAWGLPFLLLLWTQWENWRDGAKPLHRAPFFFSVLLYFACLPMVLKVPSLSGQLQRLGTYDAGQDAFNPTLDRRVAIIQKHSRKGDRVAIIAPYGHWLALRAKVSNISPFSEDISMALRSQADRVIEEIRRNGVRAVYGRFGVEIREQLTQLGFNRFRDAALDEQDFEIWKK